jgi:hypothetical protein
MKTIILKPFISTGKSWMVSRLTTTSFQMEAKLRFFIKSFLDKELEDKHVNGD